MNFFNNFIKYVFIFLLFSACEDQEPTATTTPAPQASQTEGQQDADEGTGQTSLPEEHQPSFCDINNFEEYLYDEDSLDDLIGRTGKGCDLQGADFTHKVFETKLIQGDKDIAPTKTYPSVRKADLREANFCFSDLTQVRDLEDADLTGAKYNLDTKFPVARSFVGLGISSLCSLFSSSCTFVLFNPDNKGMVLIEEDCTKEVEEAADEAAGETGEEVGSEVGEEAVDEAEGEAEGETGEEAVDEAASEAEEQEGEEDEKGEEAVESEEKEMEVGELETTENKDAQTEGVGDEAARDETRDQTGGQTGDEARSVSSATAQGALVLEEEGVGVVEGTTGDEIEATDGEEIGATMDTGEQTRGEQTGEEAATQTEAELDGETETTVEGEGTTVEEAPVLGEGEQQTEGEGENTTTIQTEEEQPQQSLSLIDKIMRFFGFGEAGPPVEQQSSSILDEAITGA